MLTGQFMARINYHMSYSTFHGKKGSFFRSSLHLSEKSDNGSSAAAT